MALHGPFMPFMWTSVDLAVAVELPPTRVRPFRHTRCIHAASHQDAARSMIGNGGKQLAAKSDGAAMGLGRDVAYIRDRIVNVFFYGEPGAGDRKWVLIDAGLAGSAMRIERAAAERFGENARPAAIILTHGHFDHVGAVKTLADKWQ